MGIRRLFFVGALLFVFSLHFGCGAQQRYFYDTTASSQYCNPYAGSYKGTMIAKGEMGEKKLTWKVDVIAKIQETGELTELDFFAPTFGWYTYTPISESPPPIFSSNQNKYIGYSRGLYKDNEGFILNVTIEVNMRVRRGVLGGKVRAIADSEGDVCFIEQTFVLNKI